MWYWGRWGWSLVPTSLSLQPNVFSSLLFTCLIPSFDVSRPLGKVLTETIPLRQADGTGTESFSSKGQCVVYYIYDILLRRGAITLHDVENRATRQTGHTVNAPVCMNVCIHGTGSSRHAERLQYNEWGTQSHTIHDTRRQRFERDPHCFTNGTRLAAPIYPLALVVVCAAVNAMNQERAPRDC